MPFSPRRTVLCGMGALLLAAGSFTHVHAAAFDRAYTLLPLLGPAESLATGGPTLTEIGAGGLISNPAAVLYQKKKSMLLSLGKADQEGSNFSFAYGVPMSGWSIGYQSFTLGTALSTKDLQIGMAKRIGGKIPLGFRLHWYNEETPNDSRGGYALDVTTLLVEDSGFSYGAGFRNLLGKVGGSNAEAPPLFTAGVAYAPKNARWSLRGAFTKNFQSDQANFSQFSAGAEYRLGKTLTLRGGMVTRNAFSAESDRAMTFGFGYKAKSGMELNYAAMLNDNTLGTLHRLDLVTAFGEKSKEPKEGTIKDATLPEDPSTLEPVRVSLASATTKDGERVAVIVDPSGSPISNQEAGFLTVRTWGPESVKAGEELELTAVFENLGKTAAKNVHIYTNKPEGTSFVDKKAIGLDTDAMSFKDEGNKFLWEIPELSPGSFGELNVKLKVASDPPGDTLEFFSEAGWQDLEGRPYLSQESNLTKVAVIKEKEPEVVKEDLLKGFDLARATILLNTDEETAYKDLKNHWAEKEISLMKRMGLLANIPGPFYYPDRPLDERRFYEMLLLAQIYLRFRQPLPVKVKVAEGVKVEVILKPAGEKEGVLLLEQAFKDEGEYSMLLEREFLNEFQLAPGDYDLVIRGSKGSQDPDLLSKPVKILGSLVDLSPAYFEGKGLTYEEGVSRLSALFAEYQVDAGYLTNLLDGSNVLNRQGAAKAVLSALGVRISEDDVAAYQAVSPFETSWKDAYERLVLTLASAPITERGRRGLLDALNPQNPGGKDSLTRAQGAVLVYRFLEADPTDYRPSDLLARVDALVPSAGLGGPWFRVTAGSFISQDYAQEIAEYFKDNRNLEADVIREWVGDKPVYTVQLARNLTESAARDFSKSQGRARYPVHVLAMTKSARLRPTESRFTLDKDTLEDLRRDRLENSLPLNVPAVEDAERISQPFNFDLDNR